MRFTKYSKWSVENWDDLSLEELMSALSDFLLESGFNEQMNRNMRRWQRGWDDFEEDDFNDFKNPEDALQALRDAIREALKNSGVGICNTDIPSLPQAFGHFHAEEPAAAQGIGIAVARVRREQVQGGQRRVG